MTVINGLLKSNSYKEVPTISDTQIMTEMLTHALFPYLIKKRSLALKKTSAEYIMPCTINNASSNYPSSSSTSSSLSDSSSAHSSSIPPSSSSSSSYSDTTTSIHASSPSLDTDFSRIPPPMLMFLDGDYPQTMALINGVLSTFEDDNISVLKCPGGTSGISQPNDLMKLYHMIFRQATALGEYWKMFDERNYTLPDYWENCLLPYFRASGISSASQDTFGYFFSTLRGLISKSFTVNNIDKGNLFQCLVYNLIPFFLFHQLFIRLHCFILQVLWLQDWRHSVSGKYLSRVYPGEIYRRQMHKGFYRVYLN